MTKLTKKRAQELLDAKKLAYDAQTAHDQAQKAENEAWKHRVQAWDGYFELLRKTSAELRETDYSMVETLAVAATIEKQVS